MDDLGSLLSSLTPEDIDMLKSAASQLLGDGQTHQEEKQPPAQPPHQDNSAPDLSALLRALGAAPAAQPKPPAQEEPMIDPAMIANIAKIFSRMNSIDDKRTQFIAALKPLLNESRQKKADQAIKMLKLFELRPMLREQGLFNLF